MGMTIEEALKIIKDGRVAAIIIKGNNEDETKFNQENIEALNVIVGTMRKYQRIVEICDTWYDKGLEAYDSIWDIIEVIEDDNSTVDNSSM